MRATATVHAQFSASHIDAESPACNRLHGHRWDVDITYEGQISPKTGTIVDAWALAFAATRAATQLDHRDINAMLPAVPPTPFGVAVWFREQLLLEFPSIVAVTVAIEDYTARVEWPLR